MRLVLSVAEPPTMAEGCGVGSASQRAYNAIREMILAGIIEDGAPLREESLAQRIGVSRTPIREAFRRLDAEGLVQLEVHRGARVTAYPPETLDEIFSLRAMLEGRAARLAAEHVDPPTVQRLRQLAEEMIGLADERGQDHHDLIADLNNEFHRTVLEATGSAYLLKLREDLVQVPLVQRTFHRYSAERLRRSVQHHAELVDALASRDGDWAEAVMRAHILGARHVLPDGR